MQRYVNLQPVWILYINVVGLFYLFTLKKHDLYS